MVSCHLKTLTLPAQDTLAKVPQEKLSVVPPCVDVRGITTYLNRADVRKALHIPAGIPQWEICRWRDKDVRMTASMYL